MTSAADSGQGDIEHGLFPPLSRLSSSARDSVYRRLAERGTWYTPTLVVSRAVMLSGDSARSAIFGPNVLRDDERRQYAAPWLLEWWSMQVEERALDTSSVRVAEYDAAWKSNLYDVKRMQELGVRILAGSDAGSVLIYPGFALHEELRLLVEEAGLAPRAALWGATVGPAKYAGLDARLGRIAKGQVADLVLLDANPLESIRNTRRISGVMQAGRFRSRTVLDGMLGEVRRTVSR